VVRSLRELLSDFLQLLIEYRSVEAIDGNVKPVPFFPFDHEVCKTCGIGRITARLRDHIGQETRVPSHSGLTLKTNKRDYPPRAGMSAHEIIAELPKLSEEERDLLLRRLVNLDEPLNRRPPWRTPYAKVCAPCAKRRLIPQQKYAPGSPHGLRGDLFRGCFSRPRLPGIRRACTFPA
jgi:hypothetical protein